jgi:hypothetical protein
MQVLAEDRWEDYEWRHDGERFAYWRDGFSWIERPELDPLGIAAQEYQTSMTTIPDRSSDLSFYLKMAAPLPQNAARNDPRAQQLEQTGEDSDCADGSGSESTGTCVEDMPVQTMLPKEASKVGLKSGRDEGKVDFVVPV